MYSLASLVKTMVLRLAVASCGANFTSHLRWCVCCSRSFSSAALCATAGTCGTKEPPGLTSHLNFLSDESCLCIVLCLGAGTAAPPPGPGPCEGRPTPPPSASFKPESRCPMQGPEYSFRLCACRPRERMQMTTCLMLLASNKSSGVKLLMSLTPASLTNSQNLPMFSRWAKGISLLLIFLIAPGRSLLASVHRTTPLLSSCCKSAGLMSTPVTSLIHSHASPSFVPFQFLLALADANGDAVLTLSSSSLSRDWSPSPFILAAIGRSSWQDFEKSAGREGALKNGSFPVVSGTRE
mmetsp:Transcript_10192/g.25200  ORF Transcript_10192/g.25200 Transcript_10192/m.25200 type:complete len:295 (+) Transcript_10192:1239-2123(+)